jgi:hypothetical protein
MKNVPLPLHEQATYSKFTSTFTWLIILQNIYTLAQFDKFSKPIYLYPVNKYFEIVYLPLSS